MYGHVLIFPLSGHGACFRVWTDSKQPHGMFASKEAIIPKTLAEARRNGLAIIPRFGSRDTTMMLSGIIVAKVLPAKSLLLLLILMVKNEFGPCSRYKWLVACSF